ncbi:MAG: hypothetical protein QF463_07215 [Vicinamibacterales bacterium]|nr:hypothetical protein [Vicinamibacterales bacterium]MDP6608838.1 hypothetical protein [Vicinamibacterales bacterium]
MVETEAVGTAGVQRCQCAAEPLVEVSRRRSGRDELECEKRWGRRRVVADRQDPRHPGRVRLGQPRQPARLGREHPTVRVGIGLDEDLAVIVQGDGERIVDAATPEPTRRPDTGTECLRHGLLDVGPHRGQGSLWSVRIVFRSP